MSTSLYWGLIGSQCKTKILKNTFTKYYGGEGQSEAGFDVPGHSQIMNASYITVISSVIT